MKLLYITYIDTEDKAASGSSVRALKMLEAFRSLGIEIMLLEGWNRKDQRQERTQAVAAMQERLRTERPDACYVELPSGPLFLHVDRELLRQLRVDGIPIAYFYGDAYWKFPQFRGTGSKRSLTEWLKEGLIYWAQRYCLRLYQRTASLIYYPSATMAEHFNFAQKRVSYPGSVVLSQTLVEQQDGIPTDPSTGPSTDISTGIPTGIYVGGASYRYGATLMLEAFRRVNENGIKAKLLLVCDPKSWQTLPQEMRELEQSGWLERQTAFGDEQLRPLYARAQFACLPLRRNIYNDFAMSIKLFEYLTYGKPIVSTNCSEMAAFIERTGVGVVARDNEADYAQALLHLVEDEALYDSCQEAVARTRAENTWLKRAQAIVDDLQQIREQKAGTQHDQ